MNSKYKKKYGITLLDYESMVENQNGLCAVCNGPPQGAGKNAKLHVDHDHSSGRVRRLLCNSCNAGLGYFRDNITLLDAAINYLKEHQ